MNVGTPKPLLVVGPWSAAVKQASTKFSFGLRGRMVPALALLCAYATAFHAAQAGFPDQISVLGASLDHTFQQEVKTGLLVEYIKPEESLNNWTLMFAVRYFAGPELDPRGSAEVVARRVDAWKATDPVANFMVLRAPDGKSFVIDFLVSDEDVLEQNVFRYFKTERGLVSYQIARRVHKPDEHEDFIRSIPKLRDQILREIMREDLGIPLDQF